MNASVDSLDIDPAAAEAILSHHSKFSRVEWSSLRFGGSKAASKGVQAAPEAPGHRETGDIYYPLSHLLRLRVAAARQLWNSQGRFLGRPSQPPPFIIGIAGSVAVGKSTLACELQKVLSEWPERPRVELVQTDGFLRPNAWMVDRGLAKRKGFPETYDMRAMLEFLGQVKRGATDARAPVYCHETFDVLSGQERQIGSPDILLFEGLNVLQGPHAASASAAPKVLVSDFFDFSLYLDADERHIEAWYVERAIDLRGASKGRPPAYFEDQSEPVGMLEAVQRIWREINLRNLRENIFPTRERADVVLRKAADNTINEVWLRRS